MKKLMFAVAALAAGVACADIISTNTVGYQTISTTPIGHKMIAPTFVNVGGAARTLADIKVAGYAAPELDEDDELVEGTGVAGGDFIARFMKPNGTYEVSYYWIDDGDIAAGWYANGIGKAIPGGAESVVIPEGQALWTLGSSYEIVCAGQVNTSDIEIVTTTTGHKAIGNATPCDLTLADLSVVGYAPAELDEDEELVEGTGVAGGDFILRFMKPNGTYEVSYYWIDDGDIAAGWYANAIGKAIPGGAASVSIPAGQGLWVLGSGHKISIPAPEL